jgi:poly(ADP-ribose) glycohydrolase
MHSVLYHLPITDTKYPPKPHKGFNKWDSFHVHLPCSPKNQYPVIQNDGTTTIEPRWKMIEDALKQPIQNSRDLEQAILSYNSKYANSWKFDTLHQLFEQVK